MNEGSITLAEIAAVYPGLALMAQAASRQEVDPETAQWLDGPGLVRWLRSVRDLDGMIRDETHPGFARRIRKWEGDGAVANVAAVDRLLVALDLALWEIPDVHWRGKPLRIAVSAEERAKAVRRLKAGERPIDIARELGVDDASVARWATGRR